MIQEQHTHLPVFSGVRKKLKLGLDRYEEDCNNIINVCALFSSQEKYIPLKQHTPEHGQQEPMELIPRARDPGISELSKPPNLNHNRLHSTPRPDSAGRVD